MVEVWVGVEDVVGLLEVLLALNTMVNTLITHLLDDRKNPRHSIVVTVRANAQIDLLGVLVGAVRSHQTKQRVLRCLLHGAKGAHGSIGRHVELVVELAKALC